MMSQCVPRWDLDETSDSARVSLQTEHHADSTSSDVPVLDYEVAELRWENGKLAFNCIGQPRVPGKSLARYTWEKPRASETLEAIVSQAIRPPRKNQYSMDVDALVPCADRVSEKTVIGSSTYVAACSAAFDEEKRFALEEETAHKSGESATADRKETRFTVDTGGDLEIMTSTETNSSGVPMPSRSNPSTVDDHGSGKRVLDEEGEDKNKERCSVPTKKSRVTATHNQSERKRRDKINQRMKTLQKLVPNSNKTDKASMLDEVIEYLKQLQGQVQMMKSMNNMSQMMVPVSLPQLQMRMMTQMMGMGVMDMNSINSAGGVSPLVFPVGYIPTMANWDVGSFPINRHPQPSAPILPDLFSNFMACHPPQQLNVDAYNRMVTMYQQFCQQPPAPPSSTRSEI